MPPGGDQVGSAYVEIHVDAAAGEAELDKLMAKADRDFAELGRKKAEAELTVKTADFDRKIDEAKDKLDYFKMRRANATLDLAKSHFDEEVAAAEAELKALGKQKVKIQIDAKQVRAANKETKLLSDARALDEKHALSQASAERKLSTERSRGTLEAAKARAEIARLGDEYEKLRGRQKAIEKSSARVFSPKSVGTAESERRALERVTAEADHVKAKIESMGGSVEGLDARMGKNTSLLDKWLSRLGDTSVRIGPITTSIKGLATGLGLLGPLIFELGGGAADLIGFLGSGIAGAAAVGGAGLAGFATSAVGVGLVIKPMVKEFGEVKKAEEAVAKAELKYGKGSEQVKTAQEQLNHELKGVSPIAKAAIQDYGKLGGEWRNLTKSAKPAVFDAFGQGLKTVQALLPEFAHESVATTKVAAGAWSAWMKSLRSSGAKQVLGEVMSNFRASIPSLAAGLGDITAMLGHIAAAASHFLPGLSHGFADWAHNLEESVGSGTSLVHTIGNMVHNMRDFGHLAQDSGSFLVHFFGDAAGAGDELNNSLDHTIQSWDKWAQTRQGEESLKNFFTESAGATKDFFAVLGGAVKLLFEFSQATAPIANGLLHIVTFIGQLVSAADRLVGVKQILTGVGYALAGLYVAGKVEKTITAIANLGSRVGSFLGLTTASTVGTDANTAALEANTAAMEANAVAAGEAGAARGLEGLATAGDDAALAMNGAAAEAGGLSALLAPEVLIPAAVIGGLVLLGTQVEGVGSSFEEAEKASEAAEVAFQHAGKNFQSSSKGVNDAYHRREKATNELKDAEEKTVKAIEKHGDTSKQAVAATKKQEAAERASINSQKSAYAAAQNNVKAAKEVLKTTEDNIKAKQEEMHTAQAKVGAHAAGRAGFVPGVPDSHEAEHVAEAVHRMALAEHGAAVAAHEMAVANIVNERSAKGLAPITDKTARSLQGLSKSIGVAATKKIGNFVNPGDVSKVANLSNKLTKLGQGTQVKKIDVKSQGANQAVSQLQRLNKQSEKVSGGVTKLTVKSNDTQANQSLRKVAQQAQAIMGSRPVLKILGNASNAEQAVKQLKAHAEAAVNKQYKAELKAEDKSGQAASNFHHNLQGVANEKYNARLGAIDQATHTISGAEGKAKRFGAQNPHATLSATDNASAIIEGVRAKLAALNGQTAHTEVVNTTKNVIVTEHKGHATGGPMFAGGGSDTLLAAEQYRATQNAVTVQGGVPRLISQPTYLVGEQAPRHPEYVLAMNPAYRGQNERYLDDAAGHLGKEVIPMYAKGSGGKKSSSGGSKGSGGGSKGSSGSSGGNSNQDNRSDSEKAGPKPYAFQSSKHWKVHNHKFAPESVANLNTSEATLQNLEGKFNAELRREEQEIEHNQRDAWDFGRLKGFLSKEEQEQGRIINTIIPNIVQATGQVITTMDKQLKGPLSKGKVAEAKKQANHLQQEYDGLQAPEAPSVSKKPGESDAAYSKRKKSEENAYKDRKNHYEAHKKKLKGEAKQAAKYASLLEKERAAAIKEKEEAENEQREVRHEAVVEHETALEEIQTESSNVGYIEQHPEAAPYYENPEEEETPKEKEEKAISERGHPNIEAAELAEVEAENRGVNGAGLKPYQEGVLHAAEAEFNYAKSTAFTGDDLEAAQALRSAQQAMEGAAGNAAEEIISSQSLRAGLYQSFAGNLAGLGTIPSAAGGMWGATNSPATPAYLPGSTTGTGNPGFSGSGSIGQSGPSTSNTIVNNFAAPPPDPHTWTAQQSFELGALA